MIEYYIISTIAAAVGLYKAGDHNLKHIAYAAIIGVGGPVLKGFWEHVKLIKAERSVKVVTAPVSTEPTTPVATTVVLN